MDMNIAGSGQIAPGEYKNIRISGSGHLGDSVRCESLHSAGSVNGGNLTCNKELHTAGSCHFSGNVKVESMKCSGGSHVGGDLEAAESVSFAGGNHVGGDLKCKQLQVSGKSNVGGDVEAETVKVRGAISCEGLLNAEEVDIEHDGNSEIGSIGGSKITIYKRHGSVEKKRFRLLLFSRLVRKVADGTVRVKTSVEGDEIALEGVVAPRVSGRIVAIGAGCDIELVQYSEQVEVSPEAKVGKTERI